MVELGIIDEGEHVELLHGLLVEMPPQGPLHSSRTTLLADSLRARLPTACHLRVQMPLALDVHNLPEPDLAVVRGRAIDWDHRHPDAPATLLVIEVAHSSQGRDRAKADLYGRAGIPVYWLLDLAGRTLVIFDAPAETGAYRQQRILHAGEQAPLPWEATALPVANLLP